MKIISALLGLSCVASAMSSKVAPPPFSATSCDGAKSLTDVMVDVRQSPSISALNDTNKLELLIATSCEATHLNPDRSLMALGEAIFVGSAQKKAILFCSDKVSGKSAPVSGYAHIILDETGAGTLHENSSDHRVPYDVQVSKQNIDYVSIVGRGLINLGVKSVEFERTYENTTYLLNCEVVP